MSRCQEVENIQDEGSGPNMALPEKFSLLHSELNDFLFAQMGEEESGAPLSVLSALTRLGIDPWAEGARLSDLPRDVAAQVLVPMIVMFPEEKRGSSDVRALAERLAALLPQRDAAKHATAVMSGDRPRARLPRLWLVYAGFLLLLGMAALGLLPGL
jgi:hypothetical protein